jgi:hypothetical protein
MMRLIVAVIVGLALGVVAVVILVHVLSAW